MSGLLFLLPLHDFIVCKGTTLHFFTFLSWWNHQAIAQFDSSTQALCIRLIHQQRKATTYMSEHHVRAGATVHVQECDSLSRVPYLNQWFRT